jgi:hypothetical protein
MTVWLVHRQNRALASDGGVKTCATSVLGEPESAASRLLFALRAFQLEARNADVIATEVVAL